MNPTYEEVKTLVLTLLGHDRWNSGLSDERLAEKIAVTLVGQSAVSAARQGVLIPSRSREASRA